MPSLQDFARLGEVATVLLECAVLVKVVVISRSEPLRSFAFLVCLSLLEELTLSSVPVRSQRYFIGYALFECLRLALSARVVLKIYQSVFRQFPGIRQLSTWGVSVSFVIAVLLSIYFGDGVQDSPWSLNVQSLDVAEVLVSSTFVFFLLLIQCFLLLFPVRLNRNTIVHTFAFGVLFLAQSLAFFQLGRGSAQRQLIASLLQFAIAGSYSVWLFGLTKAGEGQTGLAGGKWNPDRERKYRRQLHSLEDLIVATSKGNRGKIELTEDSEPTFSPHSSDRGVDENE